MNLETRKYNIIQELSNIDELVLDKLELFLKTNKKDWFLDLSNEEKLEIEIGIIQANSNELINNDLVMNRFSKWHS